jgi:hypothetical protein
LYFKFGISSYSIPSFSGVGAHEVSTGAAQLGSSRAQARGTWRRTALVVAGTRGLGGARVASSRAASFPSRPARAATAPCRPLGSARVQLARSQAPAACRPARSCLVRPRLAGQQQQAARRGQCRAGGPRTAAGLFALFRKFQLGADFV